MLANLGFGDTFELFAVACAWRNLLRMVGPDLVVFDHSPTALLASRGLECRRALIGSGFCCPPDESPMPVFRPEYAGKIDPEKLAKFEQGILDCVNQLLETWGEEPMERLSRLYADADENFLTTFPELDHYPQRAEAGAAYWGPVIPGRDGGGEAPRWPAGGGRRVFAYLKKFANLPDVLDALADAGHPTIAYVEGASAALRRQHETDTLHFADGPLDLARVGQECDSAVLNAGHGVTAEMLLAGKPILQIPLALEQRLTADGVARMGAGLKVPAGQPDHVRPALEAVLNESRFTDARDSSPTGTRRSIGGTSVTQCWAGRKRCCAIRRRWCDLAAGLAARTARPARHPSRRRSSSSPRRRGWRGTGPAARTARWHAGAAGGVRRFLMRGGSRGSWSGRTARCGGRLAPEAACDGG
ncbi:MAG TPA: hypothetical protein VFB66_11580 [Tepidisphaeraceae bacterium]|nr:hypothetical protein [Tepidisphaeraceae bacterium]